MLSNTESSRLSNEIYKLKIELEITENEKHHLEDQIRKIDSDSRLKDTENYRYLMQQLTLHDKQIRNYKTKIQEIQGELIKDESLKNSRSNEREKNKKKNICPLDHNPQSCPYLHLSLNDKKNTISIKSQFN